MHRRTGGVDSVVLLGGSALSGTTGYHVGGAPALVGGMKRRGRSISLVFSLSRATEPNRVYQLPFPTLNSPAPIVSVVLVQLPMEQLYPIPNPVDTSTWNREEPRYLMFGSAVEQVNREYGQLAQHSTSYSNGVNRCNMRWVSPLSVSSGSGVWVRFGTQLG